MENIEKLRFENEEEKVEFMELIKEGYLLITNKFDNGISYVFEAGDYYDAFIFDNNGIMINRLYAETLNY